jgi:putative transposase
VGDDAYFWKCHRYIELNPVRAGLVDRPEEYRWSSYCRNALGRPDRLVTPHAMYLALSRECRGSAAAYRRMFGRGLDEAEIASIRAVLRQERVYGDEAFIAIVESLSPRPPRSPRHGRPAAKNKSDLFLDQ